MASTINADTGVVSGITGIVQTADATGNLTLQANGNTVVTIDVNKKTTLAGNLQFADGSVQSQAGLSTGKSIAMAIVFGG
jgi:hypothetical protein